MNEKIISSLIDEIIQKIEVRPVITAATVTSSSTSTSTSLKKETRGRKPNPDKSKKNEKETHNCTECEFSTDKRLLLKKHFIAEHSDKIVEYLYTAFFLLLIYIYIILFFVSSLCIVSTQNSCLNKINQNSD